MLENINIDLRSGSLLAIVGQVGCGKTTLLHAMMQETTLRHGTATVAGSVAYVEQEPFILSASVRQNIQFGLPLDQSRLDDAVKYAQLTSDLQLFANGIETVIGERGVNISGGQKARISLARAIYSNADIVLLDDPLSAVDPEVASRIFFDCIRGFLKNKLVVLVTHQLQFLESCGEILLLKEGQVVAQGSYDDIVKTGFNIKDILDSYNQAMQDEDAGDGQKKQGFTKEKLPAAVVDGAQGSVQPQRGNFGAKGEAVDKQEEGKADAVEAATKEGDQNKKLDLVVAEEKLEGGIGFRDFSNLFSFSPCGLCGLFLFLAC